MQGRRVAVVEPPNTTLGTAYTTLDSVAVLAPCSASDLLQTWRYINETSTTPNLLFIMPCAAGDAFQTWNVSEAAGGGTLHNVGASLCVDASLGTGDPAMLGVCATGGNPPPAQTWLWNASTNHISGGAGGVTCLASDNFEGPDVELAACKTPGKFDSDQQFLLGPAGQLYAQLPTYGQYTMCLTAAPWPAGGRLATTLAPPLPTPSSINAAAVAATAAPADVCLYPYYREEGGWMGVSCEDKAHNGFFTLGAGQATGTTTFKSPSAFMAYNMQTGASGPWPSTRYVMNGGPTDFTVDVAALFSPTGTSIQAADTAGIINDNLIGNVTHGGEYCLTLRTAGMLETWTVPLAGGRWAAALVNRSPAPAAMTLWWADLNAWAPQGYAVANTARFEVQDVWLSTSEGVYAGSYTGTAPVPAHGVTLLMLSPAAQL
jgi:hypothetical protein